MQIAVTFRHIESDEGVKRYVKGKVQRLQKYVENPREVHVVLSAEKFRHIAEITIIGNGMTLNSQGRDRDLYAAIDQMLDKIERQIRERREKGRRKRVNAVPSPVPTPASEEPTEEKGFSSLIQKRHILAKPMSLEEAVVQLEISRRNFLVFLNSDSEQVNVLCRSQDGGYEWIEPSLK
ncbi:MAG: ribosome hibernation-promoting factor, HPF/YfiA family [Thermodesulfobacteriota bacterium]